MSKENMKKEAIKFVVTVGINMILIKIGYYQGMKAERARTEKLSDR